jgi:hypothetical protein
MHKFLFLKQNRCLFYSKTDENINQSTLYPHLLSTSQLYRFGCNKIRETGQFNSAAHQRITEIYDSDHQSMHTAQTIVQQ